MLGCRCSSVRGWGRVFWLIAAGLLPAVFVVSEAATQTADPRFRSGGAVLHTAPLSGPAPSAAPAAGPRPEAAVPVAGTGVKVAAFGIASKLAFGQPADDVESVSPAASPIYVWYRLAQSAPGTPLRIRVLFLAPTGEAEASAKDIVVTAADESGYIAFDRPPDNWPVGRYRAVVEANGARVTAREFEVRARP